MVESKHFSRKVFEFFEKANSAKDEKEKKKFAKKAIDALDKIILQEENREQNYFMAGKLFQMMGLQFLSSFFYQQTLRLEPKNIQVLNTYANACVSWGNREKAEELFSTALSIEPGNEIVLKSYNQALAGWGQKEKTTAPPAKSEWPSKIAVATPVYGLETSAIPEAYAPQPDHFTLTTVEKAWLTETSAEPLPLRGESARWAGFTMLYSLYYWETELDTFRDLGILSTLRRDYERMYNIISDLRQMVMDAADTAAAESHPDIFYEKAWFEQQGTPHRLVDYFDHQLLWHPGNLVCTAFLSQAMQVDDWSSIAMVLLYQALDWIKPNQNEWRPYLDKSAAELFTPTGKEKFQAFLRQQQALSGQPHDRESVEFTYRKAFNFLNRYTLAWLDMTRYFPWDDFTECEVSAILAKLLEFLTRLQTVMAGVKAGEEQALAGLGDILHDISPLDDLMERLSQTAYELNKPGPTPLFVAGEIKEITDTHLLVTVENSDREDRELSIPRHEFPEENARVGQHYFAIVKEEEPDKLLEIRPMPYYREESFEEILCSLFGEEVYEKIAARWKESEP